MDTLVRIGLSNAAVAAVLAVLAVAAGCLCRRPAVAHGLWLLVLLKLVTPPLVTVPLPWPAAAEPSEPEPAPGVVAVVPPPAEGPAVEEGPVPEVIAVRLDPGPAPAIADAASAPPPAAGDDPPSWSWAGVAGWVWPCGSAGWFLLAALRLNRFRRLLRHARPASPELQEEARRLARQMGLARCPGVWLLPGRLAPMLWSVGGAPRLLLPAGLLHRLSADARATLLAHELAHLRRRDHWVRRLEFVALGLYWWHPVAWYARREVREAEEQCCDAWVVATLPGSARTYATALVDTLDFLSAAPPAVPPLASGLGQLADLKRRLTMIMRGTTPRSLGWRGGLAVCALAVLLPLLPTWVRAQAPAPEPKPRAIEVPAETLRVEFKNGARPEERLLQARVFRAGADLEKARADLARLEAELKQKMAEVRQAQLRLELAAKARSARVVAAAPTIHIEITGISRDDPAFENLLKKLREALGGMKGRILISVRAGGPADWKGTILSNRFTGAAPGKPIRVRVAPATEDRPEKPVRILVMPPIREKPLPAAGKPVSPDRRASDLERKLDELQRALEALRREMKEGRSVKPQGPRR